MLKQFSKINNFDLLNKVDDAKVNEILNSLLANGWQGAPVLYCDYGLVTGSHRLAALRKINAMLDDADGDEFNKLYDILDSVEALDVTDIINKHCEDNDYTYADIDFAFLGDVFKGTEVEQYKDEIVEW